MQHISNNEHAKLHKKIRQFLDNCSREHPNRVGKKNIFNPVCFINQSCGADNRSRYNISQYVKGGFQTQCFKSAYGELKEQ
jgi:hypothetical protein